MEHHPLRRFLDDEMRCYPAHLAEADVAEESDIAGRPGHGGESRRLWRNAARRRGASERARPGGTRPYFAKPPYAPRVVARRRDNADMEPQRLLVLGAGPPQLGLLAAARRRNVFVIAVDRDPSAPGFQYADRRALISVEDEPAIERLAAAERIDGVIAPGTDYAVAIAARVAERLGLAHPISPKSALLATSKLARAGAVRP